MTSAEIIEELCKTLAFDDEHLGWWEHLYEDQKQRTRNNVRAVLLRLADLGSSSEMDLAVANAVRYLEPGEWDAAFTAALRALADPAQQGER